MALPCRYVSSVNPHIMAGGHYKISTGHIDSKFGISIHQMRHVERLIKSLNINVEGIHMHTGSDILDVDVFLNGAEILFELALDFPNLEYIDFGSGFKVAYKPDDVTTDIKLLGKKMTARYKKFCKDYGREIQIHFEPGKFLVSEAGYFLAKVNVIKQTTATVFAGLDTGFNHLMRPTLYEAYHHITNLSNPHGKQRVYTVVGYICETDTFAWDRPLKEVNEFKDQNLCLQLTGLDMARGDLLQSRDQFSGTCERNLALRVQQALPPSFAVHYPTVALPRPQRPRRPLPPMCLYGQAARNDGSQETERGSREPSQMLSMTSRIVSTATEADVPSWSSCLARIMGSSSCNSFPFDLSMTKRCVSAAASGQGKGCLDRAGEVIGRSVRDGVPEPASGPAA